VQYYTSRYVANLLEHFAETILYGIGSVQDKLYSFHEPQRRMDLLKMIFSDVDSKMTNPSDSCAY